MEKLIKPFLLISKPYGITSRKFIDDIKSRIGKPKIGHTGTLDPIATGLLVVALGYGTRLIPYLDTDTKEYFIKIILGIRTDTDDITGKIAGRSDKKIHYEDLKTVLSQFEGEIEQYPPLYSAKKVLGKEMYKYARDMKEIPSIKPSRVTVFDIDIVYYMENAVVLRVLCSKGTYMRSLARDLGETLGTFGTIAAIARTRVGRFSVESATTLSNIENGDLTKGFLSEEEALLFPVLQIADKNDFHNGISINSKNFIVKSKDGNFLGIAELKNGKLHPEVVINENHQPR
jgi:tRNA pseudouridine55 synthase